MLAHNVYFSLKDNRPAACQALVADCHRLLAPIPGAIFFAAGVCSEIDRPVSDRDYDVALHCVFADRATHDAYQQAELHQQFIARNKDNWRRVRVFDSTVSGPGGE
jgi:hypothetical protein